MGNKSALSSLALDLKRIAIAYHRGSVTMGNRFTQETTRWINEIDTTQIPTYISRLLKNIDTTLKNSDKQFVAENSLMYSTLLQNYFQQRYRRKKDN